jgi:hypothetical protein
MAEAPLPDAREFWAVVDRYLPQRQAFDYHDMIRSVSKADQRRLDRHRRRFLKYLMFALSRTCKPFCRFIAAGSTLPTSDIDVTSFYAQPTTLVHGAQVIVNEIYGPGFSMSRLFDMNIYVHTWYVFCKAKGVTIYEECSDRRKFMEPPLLLQQIMWGIVRIVANRREPLVRVIFEALPLSIRAAALSLHRRLLYRRRMHPDPRERLAKAVGSVEALMNQLPQKTYEYFDANSYLAYLQHDAYLTVGAYNHVVLHMQRKLKIRMTRAEYVMSLLDNLGFLCVASIGKALEVPSEKTLKYFYRCIDALINLGVGKPIGLHEILKSFYSAKLRGERSRYHVHVDRIRTLFKTNADIMSFMAEQIDIVLAF